MLLRNGRNLSSENAPDAISCGTAEFPEQYIVVGQAGKSFNSKKDPNSTNNYMDQIDVRGIWIDKLLATKTLMTRQVGIFSMDKNTDSFLNVTDELRTGILDVVSGLLTDNVVSKVPFKLIDGSVAEFEIAYDLSKSQIIDASIHPAIAQHFGINKNSVTKIQQVVAESLKSNAKDSTAVHAEDQILSDSVAVYRFSEISDIKVGKNNLSTVLDSTKYIATKSNQFAYDSMANMTISMTLEKLKTEQVQLILEFKVAGKTAPEDATTEEKAVWKLSVETIDAYLNDVIKPSKFYQELLRILPSA